MSLALDALIEPETKTCAVGAWFEGRPDEYRAKVDTILATPGISRAQLHKALRKDGFTLCMSALNNHLSGRCICTPLPDGDDL